MQINSAVTSTQESKPPNLRLHYLDGIRGLAALYVVHHHAFALYENELPIELQRSLFLLHHGRVAVCIFIILSGYCLMMPVIVNSHTIGLTGGVWAYLKRRSRRILPPYYAALLLSWILLAIIPSLWKEPELNFASSSMSAGGLLSHLLLIQNLKAGWAYEYDYPMWSVATEWQIYFLFPLLLLPIWRRFGLKVMIPLAYLIGLTLNFLFPEACFWFLGLFSLGMGAAIISFTEKENIVHFHKQLTWKWFFLFLSVICLAMWTWKLLTDTVQGIIFSSLLGIIFSSLLIYFTYFVTKGKKYPLVLKCFNSRWAVFLGKFSYSLYLIHALVLEVSNFYLRQLDLLPTQKFLILIFGGIPLSVLFAYGFYKIFEKPFLSSRTSGNI